MPRRATGKMRPACLYVDHLTTGEVGLAGEGAHYLGAVLRLRPGAAVTLFDSRGAHAQAAVLAVERGRVRLEVGAVAEKETPACALTVALALPKAERADWLVEKLTELGASRIVWVHYARTPRERTRGERGERWQRIARAAAGQSMSLRVPEIVAEPLAWVLALPAQLRLIAHAGGDPVGRVLGPMPRSVILLVGPEGGLAESELAAAEGAGYIRVSLGRHTLRVETAAVVGAGLIMALTSEP